MPQFYFHIHEQGNLIPDEEGMILRDLNDAKQEASQSCLDLIRNRLHGYQRVDGLRMRFEVRRELRNGAVEVVGIEQFGGFGDLGFRFEADLGFDRFVQLVLPARCLES